MKAVLSTDAKENAKTAKEEGKLKTQLMDVKKKELADEAKEQKTDAQVKTLQMKEVAAAKEGKEAVARNVQQIIKVQGGKVDGEIALTQATENKEKRQIARLASQLQRAGGVTKGADRKVNADEKDIRALKQKQALLSNQLARDASKMGEEKA